MTLSPLCSIRSIDGSDETAFSTPIASPASLSRSAFTAWVLCSAVVRLHFVFKLPPFASIPVCLHYLHYLHTAALAGPANSWQSGQATPELTSHATPNPNAKLCTSRLVSRPSN